MGSELWERTPYVPISVMICCVLFIDKQNAQEIQISSINLSSIKEIIEKPFRTMVNDGDPGYMIGNYLNQFSLK